MKQYLELNYTEAITNDIKNALQNNNGTLLIFRAIDKNKSSKTSIVIETEAGEKYELFNGRINNYNYLLGVQSFLAKKYNLEGFKIYDYKKRYLFEV